MSVLEGIVVAFLLSLAAWAVVILGVVVLL
jgi:hypothetical protein